MLPQQAIFENGAKGEIEKMSEPVQVYTACRRNTAKWQVKSNEYILVPHTAKHKYGIPVNDLKKVFVKIFDTG